MIDPGIEVASGVRLEDFAAELSSLKDEYEAVIGSEKSQRAFESTPDTKESMGQNLVAVLQIPVAVKAVLGSTTVPISTLMKMRRGTVLALDRRVGEPIEVTVNGRIVARGEVVVLEDGAPRLGISLTEVVGRYSPQSEESTSPKVPGQHR